MEIHFVGLQQSLPSNYSTEHVHSLEDWYHNWMAQGMYLLPMEKRAEFQSLYEGMVSPLPVPVVSPKTFIADPLATRFDIGLREMFRRDAAPAPTVYSFPVETYFLPGFRGQIRVLNESRSYAVLQYAAAPNREPSYQYHQAIIENVSQLYLDGHYQQAVSKAANVLIDAVRQKAGQNKIEGAAAMVNLFSPGKGRLRVARHESEQQGFMQLYAGMVGAVRNTTSHNKLGESPMTFRECYEWLAFISRLFHILDEVEVVQTNATLPEQVDREGA